MYSAESPQPSGSTRALAVVIAVVACVVFGLGLDDDSFADEYAYISQSYYAPLFFGGRHGDRAWLDMPAYDLPPLPKYLIGLAIEADGLPMPRPADAHAWYRGYRQFGTPETLLVARLPIAVIGVLGCLALYGIGCLVADWRVGAAAAFFLMFNPLYRLHAHRAMSDVPCETFMLLGLYAGLAGWLRLWVIGISYRAMVLAALAGVSLGLALLCKFNALLGLMVIGGWTVYALVVRSLEVRRKLAVASSGCLTAATTFVVFVLLNPFMTVRPEVGGRQAGVEFANEGVVGRFLFQVKHRMELSKGQQQQFGHNALHTGLEKAKVFVVQGFGRFGLFGPRPRKSDSVVRYDSRLDWGAILWVPVVLLGLVRAVGQAWAQTKTGASRPAVAVLIWCGVTWAVVGCYLPMAWDRYLLPIQSVNALLAALAVTSIWDWRARRGSTS